MDDAPITRTHSDLLNLAATDPHEAIRVAESTVATLGDGDHVAKSQVLRAAGLAARNALLLSRAGDLGTAALVEAEMSGSPELVAEALMSLAGTQALSGDNDAAVAGLQRAAPLASPALRSRVLFQEGSVMLRMGSTVVALDCYAQALRGFQERGEDDFAAMTLNNRGFAYLDSGEIDRAAADFEEALSLYLDLGMRFEAAGVEHNLALVAARRGDIPDALGRFDRIESSYEQLVGSSAEITASRLDVLLSAGLFREAMRLAQSLGKELAAIGLLEDLAEAQLVGAQAALLSGDAEAAEQWAAAARESFDEQGRGPWSDQARIVALQARHQMGDRTQSLASEARRLAVRLEAELRAIPALAARLLAGTVSLESGDRAGAIEDLERVARQDVGPIETRVQAWRARALTRLARGNRSAADAAARAGMGLLDRYQAALGATDIRTGVERHGAELAALGLRLALESRKPQRVLAWMERSRARALRHPPVVPSDDADQAADLSELRSVSVQLRSADGEDAVRLMRQAASLQESIRDRSRTRRGSGVVAHGTPDVVGTLAGRTLVEYASLEGELWAVTVRDGHHRLHDLGPEAPILAELESLRFTMRRLARGRGSASVGLARDIAARLDGMLFGVVGLGREQLVIVPTPVLHSVPWAALPTCAGRAVSVSPSAELWWRATHVQQGDGPVLLAAGPDLALAEREIEELGSLYRGSMMVRPDRADVEAVRRLIGEASLAHIACHAGFEVENPMFSSLRLTDGDLNVYDLERMHRVPQLVVLSACDSGFSEALPGDELMGLSSALLGIGARTLVSSVGLVPDSEATRTLMVALHENLIAGLAPAQALAEAQVVTDTTPEGFVASASFVCIGAG